MLRFLTAALALAFLFSCKTPVSVFTKKTAHEQYGDKLDKLGLRQTALGARWFQAANRALLQPTTVPLPYNENGYFAADLPGATGLRFEAKRGEMLTIELTKTPALQFLLFADLFLLNTNGGSQYVGSIDSISNRLRHAVKENTNFILRLQPEVLQSGSYELSILLGPSLAYPAPSTTKNRIISYWGAGRDRGARKHEGLDIGGAFRTPLLAIGDGYVSRVTENNLGGKVVFVRDANSNETWYYAHLDSQIVSNGQQVRAGDTIGLMGNTGNARTTVPHLHFGIYTSGGAVDPFPYINPAVRTPAPVVASGAALGKRRRVQGKSPPAYPSPDMKNKEKAVENTPVLVTAATGNLYKALMPGGETRFIPAANLVPLDKRIRQSILKEAVQLTDAPTMGSPAISRLPAGTPVDILGTYGNYQYVTVAEKTGWIKLADVTTGLGK